MALEYRRRGKRNLGKGRMFDREGAKEVNNPREFRELPRSGRGSGIGRGGRGGDLGMGIVINDTDPNSTFFRITEFPEYLGVGKNTIRLLGSNLLKKNSKIDIEVLDSQGNPIYYEIPKVKKSVKGKIISIWVYSGRSNREENTASGTAKVTIVGTGNRNEIIRWTRNVEVRANEESSSEIIFNEKILPLGVVSSSLQPFSTFELDINKEDELGQGRDSVLSLTTKSFNTKYQRSNFGDDVVITKTSGDAFTSEMVGGEIRFDLSSQTVFPRQTGVTQPTEFTSSVLSVSSSNILQIEHTLTGSKNHQYYFTDSATIPTDVVFFSSASVGQSQNLQTVATFTTSNIKPIAGEVHTLRTSVKSKGLGTEFEIIGTNTFDSKVDSFSYTVPIPSQHIGDPKTIKIEFLNKKNEPSATFILLKDIVFPGSTTFIGGKGSLITGSIFISNALGSGIEIGGASSGFIKSVGYSGFTSASTGDGPGGFLIYSGSGNLVIGSDLMEGVGFEFVSANDTSHMKFTTSGSGELDIKA